MFKYLMVKYLMVKYLCYFYSLSGISLIAQSFVTFFPRQYTDFKKQIQKLETQVAENKTKYLIRYLVFNPKSKI
jgi:hypothetical protein